MTAPAQIDPLYVAARRVLLDALYALHEHRGAVVLAGAQAVYLQAGDADLEISVAPFTTDADLAIDPTLLGADPEIVAAMTKAGFCLKVKPGGGIEPGTWLTTTKVDNEPITVPVDLLVPEALAPGNKGKRDARLPDHGKCATRWTPGLETVVLDNTEMEIRSLEPGIDPRVAVLRVAGPAALLVAKSHKIADRLNDATQGRDRRVKAKDCGDVIRLMRCPVSPTEIGARLAELERETACASSISEGVENLHHQFGRPNSPGVELAVTALAGALPEPLLRNLAPHYMDVLLHEYRSGSAPSVRERHS